MHSIIMEQKEYRDRVLRSEAVKREAETHLRKWIDTDLIKVIIGPRRAGKSWLAIRGAGKDAAYVNLDDERLVDQRFEAILRATREVYGNTRKIVIDEPQNIKNWAIAVNRLQREGKNVIVTGSNSKLLSSEMATYLTGRFVETVVLPFSYREFLQAKEGEPCAATLEEYMKTGGFPEVVVKGYDPQEYATLLLEAGIVKDVIMRYRVKFPEAVKAIVRFIGRHAGKVLSMRGITTAAELGSVHTAKKYISHLESAFLFTKIRQHTRERNIERAPVKIYPYDTSFLQAYVDPEERRGMLLETTVFLALLRAKKATQEIRFWKSKAGREVDFIIVENGIPKAAIQVAYELGTTSKSRELKALEDAKKELGVKKRVIVTMTPEDVEGTTVAPAWEFVYDPVKFVQ